jgi:hypothetical protein
MRGCRMDRGDVDFFGKCGVGSAENKKSIKSVVS